MFDWGTHLFDLMFFLLDEPAAQWVLGAADFSVKNMVFDAPMDALGVSRFRFDNGVDGVLLTENIKGKQVFIRVLGSEAMMHVEPHGPNAGVYYLGGGTPGWDKLDLSDMEGPLEHPEAVRVSIDHSVQCMKTGAYPLHGSKMALKATELIFATYASAKLDRKIELPLAPNPDWHLERLFGE
ncbi:MAG: hypothetical protein BWZ10_02045 [candidate division BRC1 bacterium ADurb.BinA364]|nr:MAG: hypothetical protein BWZ10_02045 [candidate division BRC1 bacterium ADurb.BinA364]